MEQILIEQLIIDILSALLDFNLSEGTMKSYKCSCFAPIKNFFLKNGQVLYSQETAFTFLKTAKERLDNGVISERHYRRLRKAVDLLEEYNATGGLKWETQANRNKLNINQYFTSVLMKYVQDKNENLAHGTVSYVKSIAQQFLKYLQDKGHSDFQGISLSDIKDFLLYIAPTHRACMGNVIYSMKLLFYYLNENQISELSIENILQKSARPRKRVLPCFSHDEVDEILNQINTNTSEGKRNYAIIYLAAHTGLRCVDIINLKLTDINWKKDEICIVQNKTCNTLVLPIEAATEKVIVDYILTGRPNTDSPYVFVRSVAPYTKLSSNGGGMNIIRKYRRNTENAYSPWDGKGFHALRRSMGTWLLESGIPLPTISQILGHHDMNSTKQYLSTHYEKMSECTLSLNGIETKKEGLL